MKFMMVLEDGETFSDLDGCKIIAVPDDWDGDTVPDNPHVLTFFYTYRQKGQTTWSMTTTSIPTK